MLLTMAKPCLESEPNIKAGHTRSGEEVKSTSLWFAACTQPRHEKVVAKFLEIRKIETYLPLHRKIRSWNGRRAEVDLPLFAGYVFVRLPLEERVKVLETPSVRSFVTFNGKPAPLPEEEIEALKRSLAVRCAEPYPFFQVGKRVRIAAGPLEGLEGRILRRKGKLRMIVSVDFLQRSIAVDLEPADLRLAA
jgi:transcription antitermination factor NusG